MKKFSWVLLAIVLTGYAVHASAPGPGKRLTVAFYNLENLFDTKDDPATDDKDFLPDGANKWDDKKKAIKMDNMAKVIAKLGDEDGPEILGVCEVENKGVLEELIGNKLLKKHGYGIVHIDSKDERGIDCGLLYKKKRFTPLYSKAYTVVMPGTDDKTRDILLVKGIVDGKNDLTIMVNHWPSRRGGEEGSAPARAAAAQTVRTIVDSIMSLDHFANILITGDMNDDPDDASIKDILQASTDSVSAMSTNLFNCSHKLFADGNGTLKYKGGWNLFDQMIVSAPMIHSKGLLKYVPCSAGIYNPVWMRQTEEGEYKDAPKRTYIGKKFIEDGFSDHFPVYLQLEY